MRTCITLKVALAIMLLSSTSSLCDDATEKATTENSPRAGWLQRTLGPGSWDKVASAVTSPKEASALVRHQVDYKEDLEDVWTDGRTTWKRGYGDCEDLAACVAEMCLKAGLDVKAKIFVFRPEGSYEAHAAVLGSWKGKYWLSSNGWFFYVDSMEDARKEVAKQMGWRHKTIVAVPLSEAYWPATLVARKEQPRQVDTDTPAL